MAVFSAVEARVREWRVETGAALPDAAARVGAACLEIRLDGKLLGRGAAEGVGAAASALSEAMRGADERLPVPADALREQNARLAAERAIIGLELAGVLVPFDARSAAQVDALLAPGLDGVAVRIGDRVGLVFPAEMLADGFTPSAALGLAASRTGDASLSVLEPSMLREQHGAVLYRFRTVHVATTLPGQAPIFLFRGGKPVPETSIDQASLRGMAGGIASHLAREVLEAFDDARGIATSPPMRPEVAGWDPFTRGLVARALAMHALGAEEGATRIASRYASRALCESLAASNLQTPEAAASLVNARAALCRATNTPFTEAALQIDRLVANPAFRLDPAAIARSPQAGWIALALAEAGAISPQRSDLAAEVIAAAFASEDAPPLVTAMPFLGEAEMLVAANRAAFSPGGVPSLPHAAAFAELREHLAASLYVDAASPDFAGGFVFAGSPYPTWHTARPAAFLAQMLGSRVMTPPDRSRPRHPARASGQLPHVRDEHHHGPRAPRRPRRSQALAAAHPGRDERPQAAPQPQAPEVRQDRRQHLGRLPPARRGRHLPDHGRHGPEVEDARPLIDPQGNFGSIEGDPPAAMRYTEARMTYAAVDMLGDLNFDTVDFQPNYDDRSWSRSSSRASSRTS
jgi:hypothetical protein